MEKNECLACARQCGRHLNYLHLIYTITWDKHYHLQFRDEETKLQTCQGLPQEFRIRATFKVDLSTSQVHVLSIYSF